MTETLRAYDLPGAVEYVRSIGFNGVTISTVRTAIASGRLAHVRIGKKFYVTEAAILGWLGRAERKGRP